MSNHQPPSPQARSRIAQPGQYLYLRCQTDDGHRVARTTLVEPAALHGDVLVAWPRDQHAQPFALLGGQPVSVELALPHDALYLIDTRVATRQERAPGALTLQATRPWKRVQHR